MKHSPTKGMQSAAKRGLEMLKKPELSNNDIPEVSTKGGRKISSGQQISDDHVRSMAEYHASHMGSCPTGDDAEHVDDLLWGGPAGASWAASRVAAMDATTLAESESPELASLLAGDDDFSIELYARGDLLHEGATNLKKDENGLIWAPIIRSGTIALRPDPKSPDGRSDKPLLFVPGHASTSTEIGLADLKDAFDDRAVEHVTIPRTHVNDTFENTGTIVEMKISDSTVVPGEKVILAGHKFTEPDIEAKVERGSVLSRSCGILHGYRNTGTGKTYPHVIEHVALTNRPWVTGMEPYGSDLFSHDRQVVPLMLSAQQAVAPPTTAEDSTIAPPVIFSTSDSRERLERELQLADIAWSDDDGEPSLSSIQTQLYDALRAMGRSPYWDEDSIWFSVRDVKPTKALVSIDYGSPDPEDAWIIPYTMTDGKLMLADFSQWQVVEQAWVADDDANQDKAEVQQLISQGADALSLEANPSVTENQLNLATLTAKARKSLSPSAFVFSKTREYPIHDLAHARNALARASQHETGSRLQAVRNAVYKKYPQLRSDSSKGKTNASLPDDPLKRASTLRLSQEPQPTQHNGGNMTLTPELLARLDLSDEAREVLQREVTAEQQRATELAEFRKKARADGTKERLTKLANMNFAADSGFLRVVSDLLMADDGDVAVSLNLSQDGQRENLTITQVIDRLIEAFPVDDKGKLTLAQKTNLLENPLSGRPNLEPDPAELGDTKEMTGDELLAQWQKDLPGIELALPAAK